MVVGDYHVGEEGVSKTRQSMGYGPPVVRRFAFGPPSLSRVRLLHDSAAGVATAVLHDTAAGVTSAVLHDAAAGVSAAVLLGVGRHDECVA